MNSTAENSPTAWFAVLEDALRNSDIGRAAQAQAELRRLGVDVAFTSLLIPGPDQECAATSGEAR